ncbi:hypothetical protein [Gilliamella sp. Pas-s95]|uniref:hypothetical protein n=1 Tax=Gilliamella sp. Pas-s95 TaxID=2687317 RepID=UPI0013253CEB|nr:hypothetical protein [Gilliamella sp. Pas-s95]MWN06298.1 hypothetical protein [Gilliamella sp. Pas-s95]
MKNCFSIIFGIKPQVCQAYILNLLNYLCRQKQMQYLFSSRNLAKSPRFKFLSSLSPLTFASLLLLPYSFDSQALSAKTTRVIEGSAPYFTFDGGRTRVTRDDLLTITLPDGTRGTPSSNTSSITNPILVRNISSLDDIHTVVPSGTNTMSFSDLITQGNWGDDDGDGQGASGVTASGNISVSFTDSDGNTVNRSDALDICNAPYRVRLVNTEGSLTTQYGVPRSSSFSGATVDYYINPYNTVARICHARPNLTIGTMHHAGPSNIWSPTKGFLVQSTSPSSYNRNFPTTGADGLYFDLDIGGVDGSQLTWSVVTNGSIRATVSWTRPLTGTFTDPKGYTEQADEWIRDKSSNVTRVTLHGPRADSAQISSSNPSPLDVPSLPQTFELVGRDSHGNEVRYGFVLKQWFLHRGGEVDTPSNHSSWCSRLGYRIARVSDLTNAGRTDFPSISIATPSSGYNNYSRQIGAGFFSEWGWMGKYSNASFVNYFYWTSDLVGNKQFYVNSTGGYVTYDHILYKSNGVCVTP